MYVLQVPKDEKAGLLLVQAQALRRMLTLSCRQGMCVKLWSQSVIIQEFSVHTVQKSLHPKFRASMSSAGGGEEVPQVANKMTLQKEGRLCSVRDRCVGGGAWPWDRAQRLSNHKSLKVSSHSHARHSHTLQAHRHTSVNAYSSHTQKLSLRTAMTYLWQQQGVDYFGDCSCYDGEQVTDMQTIFPQAIVPLGWERVCMY